MQKRTDCREMKMLSSYNRRNRKEGISIEWRTVHGYIKRRLVWFLWGNQRQKLKAVRGVNKRSKRKEKTREWCAVVAQFLGHVAGYEARVIFFNIKAWIKRLINEDNIVGFGFWHGCQEVVEMLVIARFLWSSSNRRSLEMASTRRRYRAT